MVYSPDNTGVRVILMPVPKQKSGKKRVHLDVRTADGTREAEVQLLVDLGAKEIGT